MRAVIQRVREAHVRVDQTVAGQIGAGLLVYVGIGHDDTDASAARLAEKVAYLRIFEDDDGKLNRSALDLGCAVLAVPNFTLLADARKGRRPAFVAAACPARAEPLFDAFVRALRERGVPVETGVFRAHMHITSTADGPVNIVLDLAGPHAGPPTAGGAVCE